ncbi:MAG: hypothetical protein AAF035_11305 [Pseudomonadota bacterium]
MAVQTLLTLRDAYCDAVGISAARLGNLVAKDHRFFSRLEGKDPSTVTARKYDSVMDWFAAHWPEACDRPVCLEDHIAVRQWEASNSYSCAMERGAPVPRVVVPGGACEWRGV